MEGPISKSVADRLPSAIKVLNETCQKTYICLRLRKPEHVIARQLNLSLDNTRERINSVRNELIKAGQIDLIEDPRFVSINADDPYMPDMSISTGEMDIDKKLVIKEFLSYLKDAVNELPERQLNLLTLRYKHQLPAKDILGFCKHMGLSLIPDKKITEQKEQDIFYGINTALKEVFRNLKNRYSDADSIKLDSLKYIFEEIGI
jgi:hypothetical protein